VQTERGFLRAITAEPDDDGLRLIFADWLDDHGKPAWAALIRRQVAACPADPDGLHRPWRLQRSGPFPDPDDAERRRIEAEMDYPVPLDGAAFRRGLVEHVTIPGGALPGAVEALYAWGPMPMLRPLEAEDHLAAFQRLPPVPLRLDLGSCGLTDAGLLRLLRSPAASSITELNLAHDGSLRSSGRPSLTGAVADILATSDRLTALRWLELGGIPIRDAGLRALRGAAFLRGLAWLGVGECQITGTGFEPRRAELPWPALRCLDLSGNRFTLDAADELARSVLLAPLRRLNLSRADFPAVAAVTLAKSEHPTRLRELRMTGCELSPNAVRGIFRSAALAGLRRLVLQPVSGQTVPAEAATEAVERAGFAPTIELLDLRDIRLGDAGVEALVRPGAYPRLRDLTLEWCGVGPRGAEALYGWLAEPDRKLMVGGDALGPPAVDLMARIACRGRPPEQPMVFWLRGCQLTDAGVERLLVRPELRRCWALRLEFNRITAAGVRRLVESPDLAGLQDLELSGNPIGDDGARALAESPHLRALVRLAIDCCELTDAGIRSLAGSPFLASLEELKLGDDPLTDAGAEALARWPHPALQRVLLGGVEFGEAAWRGLSGRFGQGIGVELRDPF